MSTSNRHDDSSPRSTDARFALLWNDFLEGDLDTQGKAEIDALLAADERLLTEAADLYQLHRQLPFVVGTDSHGDDTEASDPFVNAVLSQLGGQRSSPAHAQAADRQDLESQRLRHDDVAGRVNLTVAPRTGDLLRQRFQQLGGPHAITVWTWLATLPFSVLVSSVYKSSVGFQDVLVWTSALIGIHGVLGLLLLLARLTLLPESPRAARPVTALLVFAAVGAARAVLLQVCQEATGLGAFTLLERLPFNIVAAPFVFSAIAIVVDDYRCDVALLAGLRDAQRSLKDVRARHSMPDAFEHEVPATTGTFASPEEPKQGPWAIAAFMRIPPPIATLVVLDLATIGTVAARAGVAVAIANAILSPIPTVLGLALLRRFLPLPTQGLARGVVIAAAVAALGCMTAAINQWGLTLFDVPQFVSIIAVSAGLTGLSLVISAGIASYESRLARESAVAALVVNEAHALAAQYPPSPAFRTHDKRAQRERGLPSTREQIEAVVAAWNRTSRVTTHVEPVSWDYLNAHPECGDTLCEVISEGLVNLPRCSHGGGVTIRVMVDDRGPVIEMEAEGLVDYRQRPWVGLAAWQQHTRSAKLHSVNDHLILSVMI